MEQRDKLRKPYTFAGRHLGRLKKKKAKHFRELHEKLQYPKVYEPESIAAVDALDLFFVLETFVDTCMKATIGVFRGISRSEKRIRTTITMIHCI